MTTTDALSMPAEERYRQVESIRQSQNEAQRQQQQQLGRGISEPDHSAEICDVIPHDRAFSPATGSCAASPVLQRNANPPIRAQSQQRNLRCIEQCA
ncbi:MULTISPECIES: hypothetical protein [Lysobacter]|uniref:hypothetical protein n=1 Tax=Lysobacter TaxID=68 RepID=UPI001F285644|nr:MULTISPECIES: hypothetical protein [Lysobacter]UJB18803.1 hypothetical protein L1A79_21190 [Lysobacter capsici]UJQ27472.1 hypothetical protein L2D09_18695 [Lysobacter gummosus]